MFKGKELSADLGVEPSKEFDKQSSSSTKPRDFQFWTGNVFPLGKKQPPSLVPSNELKYWTKLASYCCSPRDSSCIGTCIQLGDFCWVDLLCVNAISCIICGKPTIWQAYSTLLAIAALSWTLGYLFISMQILYTCAPISALIATLGNCNSRVGSNTVTRLWKEPHWNRPTNNIFKTSEGVLEQSIPKCIYVGLVFHKNCLIWDQKTMSEVRKQQAVNTKCSFSRLCKIF